MPYSSLPEPMLARSGRLVCSDLLALGVDVERGSFGARMQVELENDGPVTIVLDG